MGDSGYVKDSSGPSYAHGRGGRTRRAAGRRLLVALAGLLAVLLAAPAMAQGPAGHIDLPDSMPGDRLVVSHLLPSGAFGLHSVNWDASERTDLGGGDAPEWSPDGRYLAYHRVADPSHAVDVVSRDGATTIPVADPGSWPSWSPDSTRLVYSPNLADDPRPLHVTTLDGHSRPIPGTTGGSFPNWSPNGAWIAYLQLPAQDLVVVRPDGSDRRVVARGAIDHQWSPDSTQLIFVAEDPDGPDKLLTVGRDGTGARELARFARIIGPAFSPSGRDIAFSARNSGSLNIWRVGPGGGAASRLTDSDTDDIGPTWTADGSTIGFTRTETSDGAFSIATPETPPSDAWFVASGGGHEQRITDTGRDVAREFAPGLSVRLAGVDRVRTAIELSRTFPAADTVVIARADDHPDALAGAPLAAALDAPVLLTGRDGLHPALPAELARLGADHAYLLGGHRALASQVEADLAAAGITSTTRLAGTDRFATAAGVADELARVAGAPDRVFVVEGRHRDPQRGWPDALSASGVAALSAEPILLVTRDQLPDATRVAVAGSGAGQAIIVGGPGAVSPDVQARLADHIDDVDRVAGTDRYDTSAKVADLAVAAGGDPAYPWLATGRNWPDALAAAPAATRDGGVLLLVDGRTWDLPMPIDIWLTRGVENRVQRGVLVGGSAAISPQAHASIEGSSIPVP